MTREQLQERLTTYGPRATPLMFGVFVALIAFSVAVFMLFLNAPQEGRNLWLSFFVLNSSTILLAIPLALRAARYRAKRLGLVCRHCGKLIAGKAGRVALSTGRCSSCGDSLTSD